MHILCRTFPHENGTETQSVDAGVDANGAFTIQVTDSGPMVEEMLGDWDHETGITRPGSGSIPPTWPGSGRTWCGR